ncbi:MAG: hypothetical protein KF855_03220 [Acidobacteria bacterium]|nr:hypothetical protein [Acidobacteriota bacterium]
MNENILEQYICPVCELPYDYEEDARGCCEPPEPSVIYVCRICNDEFGDLSQADEHVAFDHPPETLVNEFGLPIVPQEELEAAGQERLFR